MAPAEAKLSLLTICRKNGLMLGETQCASLERFVSALREWNRKINLISRRDEENIWFSHVLHSLAPLFYVKFAEGLRVLDLGSGGGFPGIPLAIARPDLKLVLLDSVRKKTMVLEDLIGRTGLANVAVRTARAEDLVREKGMAHGFEIVVARAVAPLLDLIVWSRPLLVHRKTVPHTQNGRSAALLQGPHLLALKGGDLTREIALAERKVPGLAITVINLAFDGSMELGLEDKKLVVAAF